jgi:hypothetical protein
MLSDDERSRAQASLDQTTAAAMSEESLAAATDFVTAAARWDAALDDAGVAPGRRASVIAGALAELMTTLHQGQTA